MIRLAAVQRAYATDAGPVVALAGLDLEIDGASITALYGASGSGKTTLLNCLGTLDQPTSGTIEIGGVVTSSLGTEAATAWRRDHLGFVYQAHNLVPWLTAQQNVELPLRMQGVTHRDRAARSRNALASVGLADRADHVPAELSGGQQQRVSIARAIVAEPDVLLADEPTGALDEATGLEIIELLAAHASSTGCTVVIATHDDAVARIADRRIDLRDGHVI